MPLTTTPINSRGEPQPATLRLRVRPDGPGGVCIRAGYDLMPGEEGDVPFPLALRLLATGRCVRVEAPAAPTTPETIVTADPVAEHRDPAPAKKRR